VSTEADDSANGLVIEWLYEHPEVGFPCLARQSDLGDERAKRVLKSLAQSGPDEVFGHVATALGEPIARGIFERAGAPTELDEPCILVTLDAAMSNDEWPDLFSADADHAYHAMRLVAVRARTGDGWGIAFERIQGADVDSAATQPFLYGSNVVSGHREADDLPFTIYVEKEDDDNADVEGFDGVEVEGPAGSLVLKESMLKDLDLRPGLATARRVSSDKLSLMLRAYLAKHPGVFWSDAHEAASWLQLGESDEFEVIAVSDAFEHCVGPDGPAAYPELWKAKPSESAMFQSLVRAIVKRDGSLFEPGESNLDFRLHALAPLEEAEDEVDEARAAWEEDFWRW
jgi:hypothetical protein